MKNRDKLLRKTIKLAYKTRLYGKLMRDRGLKPDDIRKIDDLEKMPIISKKDIVKDFWGAIGKPEDVYKFHTTSGTSGVPTVVGFTYNDWNIYVEQNVRCLKLADITKEDIIHNSTPYGMFFAGFVVHDAAKMLGPKIVPAGRLTSGRQHLNLIKLFNSTVFVGIPQYLLKLGYYVLENDEDPKEYPLKKAYVLGEPLPESKRRKIEDIWDIDVRIGYGLSEIGAGAECKEKCGIHWPEDHVMVKVINKEKDGKGELCYTTLTKTGTIAINFASGDRSSIKGNCPCGRDSLLIDYIEERLDDLTKIKGTLISPFIIDKILFEFNEIRNYLFVVDSNRGLDDARLYIELSSEKSKKLKEKIKNSLLASISVSVDSQFIERDTIPQIGRKGKRFIDLRNKKGSKYEKIIREFEESYVNE
ncbi:MAG: AMP-binding protein [Candidatus Lokiarchaeota archaeon]|nr:AMP-binding protein [Candidatus Lokiarchaeota archaeon]